MRSLQRGVLHPFSRILASISPPCPNMLEPSFLSRFTTHLKEALQKALAFSVHSGREMMQPGDLLVGLLQEKGSIGAELLAKNALTQEIVEAAFHGSPDPSPKGETITPDLSAPVKQILERCILLAHIHDHRYVGTEHLVAAILAIDPPDIHHFLEERSINVASLKERVNAILASTTKFPDLLPPMMQGEDENADLPPLPRPFQHGHPNAFPNQRSAASALETFARELTHPTVTETLDPVIGRDAELHRVIEILCRRTKNNPVLLGEPGVGKTAIVEGLASRLASGDVPDALAGKRLLSVDLALTVAGTMYRGEFEARLKQLVDEVKADPNVILFIDEMHNIVGAGSTSGSLDAANILKPALARGEIRCIGATTWGEYKKFIEADAALERRFQPISVEQPTIEATRSMLQGLRSRYESHHGVRYEDAALEAAVTLAERYITDRMFPDKAIDLLDESAASVVAKQKNPETMERLRSLEIARDDAMLKKEQALDAQRIEEAAEHHAKEQRLMQDFEAIVETLERERNADPLPVRAHDVAAVVARMTKLPIETILATEREQMRDLERRLAKRIIGQERAIQTVASAVRVSRLGLHDERRPKASLLFVGPSGTGKTELARTLAQELFGREDALVKLDMSEFSEGYSASKILGSPAGYVGYRETNHFTDAIRKRPHCVVCFDEVEKAHPDVLNLLLQILEDGRITDGTGRHISLRHAYIILTSNVGGDAAKRTSIGFDSSGELHEHAFDSYIKSQIEERFRPELINRLDHVIAFRPLNDSSMKTIIKQELSQALERVSKAQRVACTAGDDVLRWLASRPMPKQEGARAARRLIENEITHLVGKLLSEKPSKRTIRLKATKSGLRAM